MEVRTEPVRDNWGSGSYAGLVRVVEREAYDVGRDALLLPVELPDLDAGAQGGVLDGQSAQGDVLAQERGSGSARDHADLRPADIDAVAMTSRLVPGELQPDEGPLRARLPGQQGFTSHEIGVLGLERDREPDAGLEGVGLVGEVVAAEHEPGLDPEHVECIEAERSETERLAGLPHRVPDLQ